MSSCTGYLVSAGTGAGLSSGYIRPGEPAPTPSTRAAVTVSGEPREL